MKRGIFVAFSDFIASLLQKFLTGYFMINEVKFLLKNYTKTLLKQARPQFLSSEKFQEIFYEEGYSFQQPGQFSDFLKIIKVIEIVNSGKT